MVRGLFLIDRPVKEDGEGRRKNGRFGTGRCARYDRAAASLTVRSPWQGVAPPPLHPLVRACWTHVEAVTVGGEECAVKAGLGTLGARSAALGGGSGLTPLAGQPADRLDAIRPGALNGRRQEPGER